MRINVKFEYEDKALILLNSLIASPTYENLATTLMWGEKNLTLGGDHKYLIMLSLEEES